MKIHNLEQGTPAWHQFRLEHYGASEAAAMLGLSKKTKRTELLHMKATGIAKEFSEWLQENVLDKGHEVEAMARPIIERLIDDDLYPVTCSEGKLSASCDGLTMSNDVAFEHKQWNEKYADLVRNNILPEEHAPQCYQILLVTGAEKVIFTISDGTEENMVSMEVFPDAEWFERITAGWAQFEKDLEEYKRKLEAGEIVQHKEKPKAEVTIELPALFVHAKGVITENNMDEFGAALTAKLAEVRAIALVNDQDFSNAKEAAKQFRATAKAIALSKEQMLAQTETIGEAARKMDAWAKDLNTTALQLEKDVEREDKAKKEVMVLEGKNAYSEYIASLEEEIKPIRLIIAAPNFAEAIKGKRNYASMQDAIDTMLSQAKQAADASAKDIRAKLSWCKESSAGFGFLFSDLSSIIANNGMEAFQAIVTGRIAKHKADEAEKVEAERAKMEAAAKEKAEREAAAKMAEEEARIRAEERAKAEAEAKEKAAMIAQQNRQLDKLEDEMLAAQEAKKNTPQSEAVTHDWARPAAVSQMEPAAHLIGMDMAAGQDKSVIVGRASRAEILEVLSENFGLPKELMLDWIIAEFAGDIQFDSRKSA